MFVGPYLLTFKRVVLSPCYSLQFGLFIKVRHRGSSTSLIVAEKMMPVIVGVINATPLLPNESSKLNLNGGSLVGYPDPENASAGDRPVEKRPLPERRYLSNSP